MELKHFFAPDMRSAMLLVKKELGPDAIIFSHKKVDGGIEIEAAVDRDTQPVAKQTPSPTVNNSTPVTSKLLSQMQTELQLLRNMLQNQFAGLMMEKQQRLKPETTWLMGKLREMAISQDICNKILAELPEEQAIVDLWRRAQSVLLDLIPKSEIDVLNHGGVVALVGPTGVGKTTTIAKLAARYTLRHGADKVGLITTDSYRVAAKEQLSIYGNILKIPVLSAADESQLQMALETLQEKDLILIDTAGMSQREISMTNRLNMLSQAYEKPFNTCLVFAANTHDNVMNEIVEAFKKININECILTKLDETVTIGCALSTLIRHQIPAAYISTGQRVPEDLQSANPAYLVNKTIESLSKEAIDRVPEDLAEQFAGGILDGHY